MRSLFALIIATTIACIPAQADVKTLTVAPDGSAQFASVQAAIDAAPENSPRRIVIQIKPGTYKGKILVPRNKPFLAFIGEDATTTILTNDWNAHRPGPGGREVGTSGSYSVAVHADDFLAENVTFENTAGDTGQIGRAHV